MVVAALNQGVGYGVVLGLGIAFALGVYSLALGSTTCFLPPY